MLFLRFRKSKGLKCVSCGSFKVYERKFVNHIMAFCKKCGSDLTFERDKMKYEGVSFDSFDSILKKLSSKIEEIVDKTVLKGREDIK